MQDTPETPQTIGMFDARRLALMKPSAYLCNIARGPLVVTDDLVAVLAAGRRGLSIQRYKGLGEMNAPQLKETTMDPKKRLLLRVDVGEGDKSTLAETVNALMGSKPEARFRFIQDRAAFAKDLDI